MLKACQYCGRIHGKHEDCTAKLRTLRERDAVQRERESTIRTFRSSGSWRRKSEAVRMRDKRLCLVCCDEMKRLGVCTGELIGTEVHHIIALVNDFDKRLDDDNLITLCRQHHEAAEAGEMSPDYLRALVCAASEE